MNYTELNWNPDAKHVWQLRRRDLETRFALLKWIEHRNFGSVKTTPLPFKIGQEIQEYIERGKISGITHVAFDAVPFDCIYALKVEFANGNSTIFIHSNMKKILTLATHFIENKPESVARETSTQNLEQK